MKLQFDENGHINEEDGLFESVLGFLILVEFMTQKITIAVEKFSPKRNDLM